LNADATAPHSAAPRSKLSGTGRPIVLSIAVDFLIATLGGFRLGFYSTGDRKTIFFNSTASDSYEPA
jgi:hypothetical protein